MHCFQPIREKRYPMTRMSAQIVKPYNLHVSPLCKKIAVWYCLDHPFPNGRLVGLMRLEKWNHGRK